MRIYQKKYNLDKDKDWGGKWVDIFKSDLAKNIMRATEIESERDYMIDCLNNGEEIELGFFKFRVIDTKEQELSDCCGATVIDSDRESGICLNCKEHCGVINKTNL